MAQKRATSYILNVSNTMKNHSNDAFQKALDIVVNTVENKVLSKRKTDLVSVLLAGTPETDNVLARTQGGYDHIKQVCPFTQPFVPLLRELYNTTTTDDTSIQADMLDALIIAIFMIDEKCKKLKYIKHIMLLTDSVQPIDWRDFDEVKDMLVANGIGLTVVGIDLDETTRNHTNYEHWTKLTNAIPDGFVLTLDEATEEINTFRNKEVRPTPVYRGFLYLNNTPFNDRDFAAISVQMYLRTTDNKKPQSATKYSGLSSHGPTNTVTVERKYVLAPENNPNIADLEDEVEVQQQELERGYRFGKTIVKVSADEVDYTKFKSKRELTILGFIPISNIPRDIFFTKVHVVTAGEVQKEESARAISAIAHALFEKNTGALARWTQKDEGAPRVGILLPYFEPDVAVLHFLQLPFDCDVRHYQFNSQPVINKNDPTNAEAERLMDEYIDKLDIQNVKIDGSDETYERLVPEDTFNPTIYMVNTAIKKRGLNEFAPLPQLDPRLQANLEMLPQHEEISKEYGQKLQDIFKVKKAPEKKSRAYNNGDSADQQANRNTQQLPSVDEVLDGQRPNEENDRINISGLLRIDVKKIGMEDPIADFKAMVSNVEEDLIESAVKQLGDIIVELVTTSFGDLYSKRAIDYLKVMRETAAKEDEADTFNKTLHRLKDWYKASSSSLASYSFWNLLKQSQITLISNDETFDKDVQNITKEDAKKFLEDETETTDTISNMDDDELGMMAEDLLDDM